MRKFLIEIRRRDSDLSIVGGMDDTLEAAVPHALRMVNGMTQEDWQTAHIYAVELGEPVQVVISTRTAEAEALAALERAFYAEYERTGTVTVEETMQRR